MIYEGNFYSFCVNNKNHNLLILSNDTYFNTVKFILEVEKLGISKNTVMAMDFALEKSITFQEFLSSKNNYPETSP